MPWYEPCGHRRCADSLKICMWSAEVYFKRLFNGLGRIMHTSTSLVFAAIYMAFRGIVMGCTRGLCSC